MIDYPQSSKSLSELEPMLGMELIYFVIPEAAMWSVVNILVELDGPVDFEILKSRVHYIFGQIHRFAQKPVRKDKRFYWETVDAINIDDHIKIIPQEAGQDSEHLLALISSFLSAPLDSHRPLWEVHYAPRYKDGAAAIVRIHHAYGDGRSLEVIATKLIGTSAEESLRVSGQQRKIRHQAVASTIRAPSHRQNKAQTLSFMESKLRALNARLRGMKKMLSSFKKDRDTGFDQMPSEQKQAAISQSLSRASIRKASAQLQCTVNDLILSAVAGAIRNHLLLKGIDPQHTRLTVSIPVDLHSARSLKDMHKGDVLINHLGMVSLQLPVSVADGIERAAIVSHAMIGSIESQEALMQYKSLSSFHRMPQKLLINMFRSQAHKLSGLVSTVTGPKTAIYLAGQRVRGWMYWVVAAQLPGAHLGVSVTSYLDDVRIGLSLPMNAGYDVQQLLEEMIVELESLVGRVLKS